MKNRKRKLLKFCIMCLMPILLLSLFISKTYAYTLNNDGNLVSENLLNKQYSSSQGNISINLDSSKLVINGTLTGNDLYFNVALFTELEVGRTYTMSFDTSIINVMYDAWINGTHYYVNRDNDLTFTLTNELKTSGAWRFVVGAGTFNNSIVNIMINEGRTSLSYEPFGVWYKNDLNNAISYVFEGAQISLYQQGNNNLIMSDTINLHNKNMFVLQNDCTNIANYLNDYESSNPYFYVVIQLNSSINSKLVVETYNSVVDSNFIVGNGTNYSQSFARAENQSYILIEPNNYYNVVQYDGLYAIDYVNFSINLNLETVSYEFGYTDGYNKGYKSGNLNSFEDGRRVGYQQGFNEGIEQDFESQGFRTLLTTILSYPVNMVKESLNFEFMGIHVASIVLFIVSLGIVAFVIKRFKD